MLLYRLRIFLTVLIVFAVVGGIFYTISLRTYEESLVNYDLQLTVAVGTAISKALVDVTRTVEAPRNRYQVLRLGEHEDLQAVADAHGTTLFTLRMVNQIDSAVTEGNGEQIIVPINVDELDPPRVIQMYIAQEGDTLKSLAERNDLPLSVVEFDNPVLAERGLLPGDVVFLGTEIIL